MKRTNASVLPGLVVAFLLAAGNPALGAVQANRISASFSHEVAKPRASAFQVTARQYGGVSAGGSVRWDRMRWNGSLWVRVYDVRYANIHVNRDGKKEGWIAALLVSDNLGLQQPNTLWLVARYVDGGLGYARDDMDYTPLVEDEAVARNAVERWSAIGLPSWRASSPVISGNILISTYTGAIGDFVWGDRDHDGIQDAEEPGRPGVAVNLFDYYGNLVSSTVTDENGYYCLINLPAGTYFVEFVQPAGYVFAPQDQGTDDASDSDADRATGWTGPIVLGVGKADFTVDAGMMRSATIGDLVWEDLDHDGVQDLGEPGIPGVSVGLLQLEGTFRWVANTDTGPDGSYVFSNLLPGDYRVAFVAPAGYGFSPPHQGADDAVDSDVVSDGFTHLIALEPGENNMTIDAGLVRGGAIGDLVWRDRDHDGIQDASELGFSGITVNLLDSLGNRVASTVTDSDGRYLFTTLPAGSYMVEFVPPAGYGFSPRDQGADDTLDSDADRTTGRTPSFILGPHGTNLTIDAGIMRVSGIGDFVWDDRDRDGVQDPGEPGIPGVRVRLYQLIDVITLVADTDTGPDGSYVFSNLTAGSYLIEFVAPAAYAFSPRHQGADDTLDSDAGTSGWTDLFTLGLSENDFTIDAGLVSGQIGDFVWRDQNRNGIQDTGEVGAPDVIVHLRDASDYILATTSTDAAGHFLFTGVSAGTYVVQFIAPAGRAFTLPNQGADDTVDSDAYRSSGRTAPFTMAALEINTSVDAGLVSAQIGDFVWNDLNRNGVQDPSEPGIPNVRVNLLDSEGSLLAWTVTGSDGSYLFSRLDPGDWIIEFVAPAGFAFTVRDAAGSNDAVDSDAHPGTGCTDLISLAPGESDRTIDAGLVGG